MGVGVDVDVGVWVWVWMSVDGVWVWMIVDGVWVWAVGVSGVCMRAWVCFISFHFKDYYTRVHLAQRATSQRAQ